MEQFVRFRIDSSILLPLFIVEPDHRLISRDVIRISKGIRL